MTFGELEQALLNEQTILVNSLKDLPEKRAKSLHSLNESLGKIRQGYLPLTADSQRNLTFSISDNTYSLLQRSLNRQKKLLSLYRKQYSKSK